MAYVDFRDGKNTTSTVEFRATAAHVSRTALHVGCPTLQLYHRRIQPHDSGNGMGSHDFVNAVSVHCELPLDDGILDLTEDYNLYLFDFGTFTLQGDGGYVNWAFGGHFDRNDHEVTFYPIGDSSCKCTPHDKHGPYADH